MGVGITDFIALTVPDGTTVWVRVAMVSRVRAAMLVDADGCRARLWVAGEVQAVVETPERVLELLDEALRGRS